MDCVASGGSIRGGLRRDLERIGIIAAMDFHVHRPSLLIPQGHVYYHSSLRRRKSVLCVTID